MVLVAVREEDVGRLELGCLHGGLGVAAQEGIHEHAGIAVRQLEARVA